MLDPLLILKVPGVTPVLKDVTLHSNEIQEDAQKGIGVVAIVFIWADDYCWDLGLVRV